MPEEKRTGRGALSGLLGFVGLSVTAGVLVTAAVTPALAVTGMTANGAMSVFNELPEYLEIGQPMERTNIYATASDGSTPLLASFYDQNREEVGWDQVSQNLKDAAIATEDPRFYEHGGVDMLGTTRAIIATYVVGGDTQGGSTITQQYVKNVLIQECEKKSKSQDELEACASEATTADGAEGASRKLKEMRLAIGLEKQYTKDEILLGYLNLSNFGARTYGVQSASMYYFGVNASDVSIEQAATLIAILNNPNNLRIDQPNNEVNGAADGYSRTLERRNYVIDKMLEEGKITKEQHDAAIATPITPNIVQPSTGCQTAGSAAYFCDYVTTIVRNDPTFGETPEERDALLKRGGLDIYTTLDLDVQAAADAAMKQYIPAYKDTLNLGSAATTMQPGTGRVLAMVQNTTYGIESAPGVTAINFNTDYEHGGSMGFQVGSSYKVFTLIDWLMKGHSLNEGVNATRRPFAWFNDRCAGGRVYPTPGPWNPQNYDGSSASSITPYNATKLSVNTAFVAMAQKLDLCDIRDVAASLGVERADGKELSKLPSSVLGANEIAPISLATAFSAIAANGVKCDPIAIDKIVGPDGKEMPIPSANCSQVLDPAVAATAAYAMQSVMQPGGTGANARVPGAPLFGKTGTADDAYDTWITAGTTKAVTSFWIGNYEALNGRKVSMYNAYMPSTGLSGYNSKYRVWAAIGAATIAKYGGDAFPEPSDDLLVIRQVALPNVVGQSVEAATETLEDAGFGVTVGDPVDSDVAAGLVGSQDPGGATAPAGSNVTLHPSTGTPPATVPDVVNQAQTAAVSALQGAGYNVKVECSEDDKAPPQGKVTEQNPAGGTAAPKGSEVTLNVQKKNCG